MSQFKGKVHHLGAVEQVSDKFKKRVLVVNDGHAEYPQTVPFTFTQGNIDKLSNLNVGDEVEVTYELRGREWEGRYFADVNGWKVEVTSSSGAPAQPAKPKATSKKEAAFANDVEDDLPF